ncbi:L-methionine (R)-S-oxide reductase [Malassezia psittaci]|uniref:L-methionine (R)-S-oxide reductase n=1 Tax=Malassezia psittaci TaxID=1821823 RepID=A0AAF0F2B2_9BASI|nr:L-methionine (R)-S-oxide reductase [Malassezia psittaci]
MNAFAAWKHKPVNWAGFYLMSPLFPGGGLADVQQPTLWLGPFCGMPACQIIASVPGKGVCADASAILPPKPICVGRTDEYPGHIACDSQSQSEIVVPMMVSRNKLSAKCQDALSGIGPPELIRAWAGRGDQEEIIVGVLDIDCTQPNGFDQEDIDALQDLTRKVTSACDWLV